jgi:hypothetical protein
MHMGAVPHDLDNKHLGPAGSTLVSDRQLTGVGPPGRSCEQLARGQAEVDCRLLVWVDRWTAPHSAELGVLVEPKVATYDHSLHAPCVSNRDGEIVSGDTARGRFHRPDRRLSGGGQVTSGDVHQVSGVVSLRSGCRCLLPRLSGEPKGGPREESRAERHRHVGDRRPIPCGNREHFGATLFAQSDEARHRLRGVLLHRRDGVRVLVQRERDGRVTEPLLHHLRVDASL